MSEQIIAHDLPIFSDLNPEQIVATLDALLNANRQKIAAIIADAKPATWENLYLPLDELEERLHQFWSPISHLNAVKNSDDLRQAYKACLPLLSAYETELGQNRDLFAAVKQLRQSDGFKRLNSAQQKIINDDLRDFHLSGIALPEDKQAQYASIQTTLAELSNRFEENVLDATDTWYKVITDQADLAGIPNLNQHAAKALAESKNLGGYCLDLSPPCYIAVMTYADDRLLREEVYKAYVTRASDIHPESKQWDNGTIMIDILKQRRALADLLGFNNYAVLSIATKMAKSTSDVLDFLNDLVTHCRDKALEEYCELQCFAAEHFEMTELQAWDIAYYSEKLKQHKFKLDEESLRPYFPVNQVLTGLFTIIQRLYGIRFEQLDGINTWHNDVQVFALYDEDNALRGHVYIDLYARPKKRGGAWMDEFRGRLRFADGHEQTPVAYVTCNFTPPVGNKPAVLLHDEVVTLFHEFGHALQHLLTTVTERGAAGINGVAWDAVEFPSQFMEHWCWQKESIALLSQHIETGEKLPDELIDNLLAARNFHSALQNLRQLEFALFDFKLHSEFNSNSSSDIQLFMQKIRDQVAVIRPPSYNRFANSFSHIFAGGYAAGYYSYKWAEVLSADAFGAFLTRGIFDQQLGRQFLHCILEQGGAEEPLDLFVKFRGREPNITALLQDNGIQ